MQFPKLYHKTKLNKTIEWEVWTENNLIFTRYGEENGKKQTTSKLTDPKNIGKSNETTPEEQAILEATAMHKHRLDRKYSLTKEDAQETVFLPMLAHDFEKAKHKVKYPVDVQPKLNGNRMLAFWDEGETGPEIRLISRNGKFYTLPHIQEALSSFLPTDYVFDGELYIHGESLQNINRLIKKWRPGPNGSNRLEYHIYDGFFPDQEEIKWTERKNTLQNLTRDFEKIIRSVSTFSVNSEEHVREFEKLFVSQGYEGAIVRLLDGKYRLGFRSRELLKVKSFLDEEFKIVGHHYGSGRASKCVVWKCIQEDKKTFDVVPKGTFEQRETWGANAESYYGKMLTVKFQNRTDENIPFLPVGLHIRLNEDLP